MTHRYECPPCGLESDPYWSRKEAEGIGREHRAKRHDGMHAKGDGVVKDEFVLPGREDIRPMVIAGIIILIAIVGNFIR